VPGDRILTSDPGDITLLAAAAEKRAIVIARWTSLPAPLAANEDVLGPASVSRAAQR
jgi:hypothetical protein